MVGLLCLSGAVGLIAVSATLPHLFFDHERYLHDLWTAFDTANKSAYGQASSVDYFSPIGPVYDWVFRIAVALQHLSAKTIPLANAIFAVGVLLLAVLALGRQLTLGALGLVLLIAVATIVTPREPDTIFAQTSMSWLAPYNRWAAGLTAVVTVAFCCPPSRRGFPEAFVLGVAIAVVCLVKVTFGAALVGLLVAASIFRNVSIKHAITVLLGIAVTMAAAEFATGQVSANLADIKTVSVFAKEAGRIIKLITQLGEAAVWSIGSVLLYLVLCESGAARKRVTPVLLIFIAAAMASVILMQNHWVSESPIYAMLPIVAAEWSGLFRKITSGYDQANKPASPLTFGILSVLTVAVALVYPVRDGGTMVAQYLQGKNYSADEKLTNTGLAGFVIHPKWFALPEKTVTVDYKRMLDGLTLLRDAGADQPEAGPVLALNFANPFPTLLMKPSPAKVPIWFQDGRTFSEEVYIPEEKFFSDAEFVIVGKGDPAGEGLWKIYEPYVRENFEEKISSPFWTVYRKKR
ncbi:hypothetical protein [Roseibium sp. LAB1]